jgi:hypothetical protein
MAVKRRCPCLSKRQLSRNPAAANRGCVTLAAMSMALVVAGTGLGSADGNTGVASGVVNNSGYSAPHLSQFVAV